MPVLRSQIIALGMAIACCAAIVTAAAPLSAQHERQSEIEPLKQLLRSNGYGSDLEGIKAYFADFQASDDDVRQLDEWVELLGAPQYRVREAAMHNLLQRASTQSQLVNHRLRKALERDDEEVRFRARWLLARSNMASAELLAATLRLIAIEPIPGLAGDLVTVWPYCASEQQQSSFAAALKSTAEADDQALLVQLAATPEQVVAGNEHQRHLLQVAAIESLRHVLQDKCLAYLAPLLRHGQERVRLAAAIAVIDYQPLPAMETLIELLASDDPQICDRAFVVLRHVTGQNIWINAYGDREGRIAGSKQWSQWFQAHGKTAKLKLPLAQTELKQQRLLLAMFRPNKVLHCTVAGKPLDETSEVSTPSGCAIRSNGNRVVAEWAAGGISEVTPAGKILGRINLGANPNGLDLLPNGNVLVAMFNGNQVMEVTLEGKKVWVAEVDRAPTDVRRLPNGNTLVALHGSQRLVELDSKQQIVWSIGGLPAPEAARPLPNGNLLIASEKGVAEYNREGRMVWDLKYERPTYDAVYLDNGNVLVADRQEGVFEYTRAGKLVRKITDGCVRRIYYY